MMETYAHKAQDWFYQCAQYHERQLGKAVSTGGGGSNTSGDKETQQHTGHRDIEGDGDSSEGKGKGKAHESTANNAKHHPNHMGLGSSNASEQNDINIITCTQTHEHKHESDGKNDNSSGSSSSSNMGQGASARANADTGASVDTAVELDIERLSLDFINSHDELSSDTRVGMMTIHDKLVSDITVLKSIAEGAHAQDHSNDFDNTDMNTKVREAESDGAPNQGSGKQKNKDNTSSRGKKNSVVKKSKRNSNHSHSKSASVQTRTRRLTVKKDNRTASVGSRTRRLTVGKGKHARGSNSSAARLMIPNMHNAHGSNSDEQGDMRTSSSNGKASSKHKRKKKAKRLRMSVSADADGGSSKGRSRRASMGSIAAPERSPRQERGRGQGERQGLGRRNSLYDSEATQAAMAAYGGERIKQTQQNNRLNPTLTENTQMINYFKNMLVRAGSTDRDKGDENTAGAAGDADEKKRKGRRNSVRRRSL